jgi:predicted dehydrogenase
LIGCGQQGRNHLKRLLPDERVRVVALCDVDRAHLRQAEQRVAAAYGAETASGVWRGVFATGDFQELLARPEIDAVFLALPDHWHALPLIAAARAGKHVYVEKPLSLTIPDGRAMVRAVEQSGVVCQVGSQQRSMREFVRAVELARNGFLGKLTTIKVGLPVATPPAPGLEGFEVSAPPPELDYERWLGPAPWAPYCRLRCHYNFRFLRDYSGGTLTNWGAHHFDIAAWAAGVSHTGPIAIREAWAERSQHPLYDTPERFGFEAHYADGTVIALSTANRVGVFLGGAEGAIHVDRGIIEYSSPTLAAARPPPSGFVAHDHAEHHENFFDCITSRARPHGPIDEAHRGTSVLHLANLAFRAGLREVGWDPAAEKLVASPAAERFFARVPREPWRLPL